MGYNREYGQQERNAHEARQQALMGHDHAYSQMSAKDARIAELEAFRAQVARLTLEGEPNGDGTWFAPDSYADQHEALEALIRQARALKETDQ